MKNESLMSMKTMHAPHGFCVDTDLDKHVVKGMEHGRSWNTDRTWDEEDEELIRTSH